MTYDEEEFIIDQALGILEHRLHKTEVFCSPNHASKYLTVKYSTLPHEVFVLMLLDSQHRYIDCMELFRGTIDGASVYPREIVKECLLQNAAAVILCHNHPSGVAEPSFADRRITERITEALKTVDIRVLDHIVVGGGVSVSFAQRGWI